MPRAKSLDALPPHLLARTALHLVAASPRRHPSALLPLFLTCRAVYVAISFPNNPQLYKDLYFATFNYRAVLRRCQWMKTHVFKDEYNILDLFSDPRLWALDYRTRWEMSRRMRQIAKLGRVEIPGVCDRTQFMQDMWTVWFLVTENDGRNLPFLLEQCNLRAALTTYYRDTLLKESLQPGYPTEDGEKALVAWTCIFAGIDTVGEDTPEEVDEKIFMLRPYVFACAKYDVSFAPWHLKKLPVCDPGCSAHNTDPTVRYRAMTYKRFGYFWRRCPPQFVLGAYVLFLRLLERHPNRVGVRSDSSNFSQSPFEVGLPGIFSTNKVPLSIDNDKEWQRNTMCQDPHTNEGLFPLTYRGCIQGFWRGKFLFYDFEFYRHILSGNLRGVYTGMFAEQVIEAELRETLVKVKKEDVGGDGPLLTAGFKDMGTFEEETRFLEEGYGHEIVDDDDEDEEGWTKEILISGRCRTAWGWAQIRGRVRAWDGLVILCLSYSPQREPGTRWLWRGYILTGGYLVGRWRDTFTPETLRGYEGAFGLIRAGGIYYPEHFPKRMDDSAGVNQFDQGIFRQTPITGRSSPSVESGSGSSVPSISGPTLTSERNQSQSQSHDQSFQNQSQSQNVPSRHAHPQSHQPLQPAMRKDLHVVPHEPPQAAPSTLSQSQSQPPSQPQTQTQTQTKAQSQSQPQEQSQSQPQTPSSEPDPDTKSGKQ
ncbi:hypothetical protein C367_07011 [Cryptococcus neoformans Ze90-1]|nr:hypothetical protein C367_07011 [Cryptococcus neoformans var. grubii Ze90-1]